MLQLCYIFLHSLCEQDAALLAQLSDAVYEQAFGHLLKKYASEDISIIVNLFF